MFSTRGLPEGAQLACTMGAVPGILNHGRWAPPPSLHAGCSVSPWRLPVGGLGSPRLQQHLTQLLSKCNASQHVTCTLGFKSNEFGMQAGLVSRVCNLCVVPQGPVLRGACTSFRALPDHLGILHNFGTRDPHIFVLHWAPQIVLWLPNVRQCIKMPVI